MTKTQGKFVGTVAPEWLDDGRLMKLTNDFIFIDSVNYSRTALAGTEIDGASIPRILWTFIGAPYEGRYRKASVVNDYYCKVKDHSWYKVHWMFYDACLVEGLN